MRIVVPPALLHSPSPDVLAAYWAICREPLTPAGVAGRTVKEAVAAAVAVATICPYCADMHTVGLYELSGERDAEAIAQDRPAEIGDDRLRGIVEWARSAHLADGPPLPAGVSAAERAELVGVVVGFHYLSRMVNVFLSSFLLPPGLGPRSRRRLKQGLSRVLRPTVRGEHPAGLANGLLAPAARRPDAGWAAGNPVIADATARAYRTFESAGARSLDPEVRRLVLARLDRWDGEDTGLSTRWCEDLIDGLAPPLRPAARLALLTALASYQVGAEVVEEFRERHPADGTLIDVTAWASFAAARRIGIRHDRAAAVPASPIRGE
ncbi:MULTISPECIES: carboxymuconolactone decarboxylase [Actinoplanes]|uniref:carboxymuconolactone decarboxylase n=1 Tax=Actinoplanes TaxID=1865 RepID=UPI0009FA7984|nr:MULTISPECIES: carboxymuconolactone decarboxylase [Actinoplanes]